MHIWLELFHAKLGYIVATTHLITGRHPQVQLGWKMLGIYNFLTGGMWQFVGHFWAACWYSRGTKPTQPDYLNQIWRLLRGGSSLFRLILQNHEKYTVWNFASFNSTNHLEGVDFPPGSASINWRFFSEHRNNRFSGHGLETLQTQSFFWTVKFRWPLANTFGELTGSKKNHCSLVFKISDKSETNCWIIKLLTSYPEWNGN